MKTASLPLHDRLRKPAADHLKIMGLAFVLVMIFSPGLHAQYMLASWDFTNNIGATYDIPSLPSHPGFSAAVSTNNEQYTCNFWNGVETDGVYRIRKAGAEMDPQGYIYVRILSDTPWRLDQLTVTLSHNSGSPNPLGFPIVVNVEASASVDFIGALLLGSKQVSGTEGCVFDGPFEFAAGEVYIRFRSATNIPDCSNYLGVDDIELLGTPLCTEEELDAVYQEGYDAGYDTGYSEGYFDGLMVERVTICHKPHKIKKTLTIPRSALSAHLRHGDTLGACNE